MKRFSALLLFVTAFAVVLANDALAQNWELVWSDEFDGSEVDATKWAFQIGDGCPNLCGWGNGEEQYYTQENASVEGGVLKITVRQEDVGGRAYTSSRMRTLGQASWTYGRVVTRAKMPRGIGFWPAIWMLPSDEVYGTWAASGEIDIVEVFGNDPATVFGTVHYGGESPRNTFRGGSHTLPGGDFSTAFHEFAIEWVPGEIRWYLDGNLYHVQDDWYSTAGRFPAPFDQPFHLLVNVAMGGAGGAPGAGTILPQAMEIDYIRVFQSDNQAPSVALDSPADGAILAAGSELTLTATASDTDGDVSRVIFYSGDAALGTVSEAPFEMTVGPIAEGCYVLRARAVDNLGGETWSDASAVSTGACVQAPYLVSAAPIPGVVQAENYDLGGESVAYHDLDTANGGTPPGGGFRVDEAVDVDYALGSEQGYFVRDFVAGEWLEYSVDVEAAGAFNMDVRGASEAGASLSIWADGAPVATGVHFAAASDGAFSTTRAMNALLDGGKQIIRILVDDGSLAFDHLTVLISSDPPQTGAIVIEDFTLGSISEWGLFGSAAAEIAIGSGANRYLKTTYSGAGGSGTAFYGVIWKNFDNALQPDIPADPWLSLRVRHSGSGTTVDRYVFETTIREDTNGNGWSSGAEDSHRLDTPFDTASFNDEWIRISAPLSSFTDLSTGGNGILEGAIDEIVFVVSGVAGPNPSAVQVDIDDIVISSGPVGTGRSSFDLPQGTRLHPPWPNPSGSAVSVGIELPSPGPIAIRVFDVLGRRVQTLADTFGQAGFNTERLDVGMLAPGVYLLNVTAAGQSMTERLVISR